MADVVIVRDCKHGQVRVLYGDIVRVEGDVMVIPANSRLAGREGLDERMQQAAGPGIREACLSIAKEKRKLNQQPCGVGEAVITPGFELPASNLVHVVGPDCRRKPASKPSRIMFAISETISQRVSELVAAQASTEKRGTPRRASMQETARAGRGSLRRDPLGLT